MNQIQGILKRIAELNEIIQLSSVEEEVKAAKARVTVWIARLNFLLQKEEKEEF